MEQWTKEDVYDEQIAPLMAQIIAICKEHRIPLVQVSSDYVFDGTVPEHDETEPFSPLGVYGQTKAAGDALVAQLPRHYIVRTTWLIGARFGDHWAAS